MAIGESPREPQRAPAIPADTAAGEAGNASGLDLRHLRYFIAVAEELHFGRAARRLHMSQPPLSQQIRVLERHLGVTLLYRDSHSVRLTAAGSALLAEAPKLLAEVERLCGSVRRLGTDVAGPLRIALIGATASVINGRILRVVATRYPRVVPEVEKLPSLEQMRTLREGDIEVGFIWETADDSAPDPELDSLCLYEGELAVAIARTNPLAACSEVTFEQLARERLVMIRRRSHPDLHDAITVALRRRGITMPTLNTAPSGIVEMVEAGLGVALVPSQPLFALGEGVVVRPLAEMLMRIRASLVWLRGNRLPALERYIELARELKESGQLA